jgi:glycosyltransferase involved in cell wall biosynthesis
MEGFRLVCEMRLIAASGLFDRDWYLAQNPDVATAGVNPLRHYLRHGALEGRDPSPFFNTFYYLEANPDVAAARINPLVHFVKYGAAEGRPGGPLIGANTGTVSELIPRIVAQIPLASHDGAVAMAAQQITMSIAGFCLASGSIDHVLALNFYAGGGAETAALGYVRFWSSVKQTPVLLIMTDNGPRRLLPELPSNVLVVDLEDVVPSCTHEQRTAILYLLLRFMEPRWLHVVNSVVAWNLIERLPIGFLQRTSIIGSVFMLQFARHRPELLIGYAARYLPTCIERIESVVTDNAAFAQDAPRRLGLVAQASKFKVIYNVSKLDGIVRRSTSRNRLQARLDDLDRSKRLRVVWAGRVDIQKRIDLLIEIAEKTQHFCDFRVFGESVLDGHELAAQLAKLRNVEMCGPFGSPSEWDDPAPGHVFLFTSEWEGMPYAVIEAAFLGYPIVATAVGGVPELITPRTGWPVAPNARAANYIDHLRAIADRSEDVLARVERLIALVHDRHSANAFNLAMNRLTETIQ